MVPDAKTVATLNFGGSTTTCASFVVGADPDDVLLLDDLLGIRDVAAPLPEIASDARRRYWRHRVYPSQAG